MKLIVRRVLIGLVCGAVSSLFLCLVQTVTTPRTMKKKMLSVH